MEIQCTSETHTWGQVWIHILVCMPGKTADMYICFYVFGFSNIDFYSSDVHSLSPDLRGLFLKTKHYSYYLGLVLDLNAKVKP